MSTNVPKNFPGGAPESGAAPAKASALPKNFQPAMATPDSVRPTDPLKPEVTRAEIAEHFARRVITLRDQAKGNSTRPWLFVVENPFSDFELDIAHAYARITNATLHPGASAPTNAEPTEPLVMLGSSIASSVDGERFVHYLNHGNDVTIVCPKAWMLPRSVQDLMDATVPLPRFDTASFAAACADFYELGTGPTLKESDEWVGNVVPRDFLLNSQVAQEDIVPALRRSVERRLARYSTERAFALDDLSGIEEARDWASGLVAEIRAAREGRISWNDIDNRVILTGRRGVGKTSLCRAIAKAADVRFVETSASNWMSTEREPSMGFVRLRADFEEALAAAPAVFFIDDVDVFNSPPWSQLIGYLLQHLQSLTAADRLIVIGGAQASENVRFELRRRGGLESMLAMPTPSSYALARMYQLMLKDIPHALAEREFEELGRLSLGLAGHELDLIVRRALRLARSDGARPVRKHDLARVLIQELVSPVAEGRRRLMAEDELRNTAYHEAGHAILMMLRTRGAGLRYATIIPRENNTLGFVMPGIDETRNSLTRQDFMEMVRIALAGRAAEEVLGGKDSVTTGCSNDLEKATQYLQYLLTRAGFNGLLSLDRPLESSPELRTQAEEMLNQEYAYVLAFLQRHRVLLDQVARLLIERQEVPGDELTSLFEAYRAKNQLA